MNSRLSGFIDIHSHFLPGIDDGPEYLDQCLETAVRYREIGVECIIATPHYIQGTKWAPTAGQIHSSISQVTQKLAETGIHLQILPGMEITLTDFLCRNFSAEELLPLGNTGTFLVECSLGATLDDPAVKGLQGLLNLDGCSFILAHPERCTVFQEHQEQLHFLVAQGIMTQLNIGSVIGQYGKKIQETAFSFLRSGLVHFLATDSHAKASRLPPDTKQLQQLTILLGEESVREGMHENPRRMLEGEKVLPILSETVPPGTIPFFPAMKGWRESLKRLFSGK